MYYDIFNGDADGICALHQLRLAEPRPDATLITGVKRDIQLLGRPELADISNCELTVLDISLDSNRTHLLELLERGNRVRYIDHHAAEPIPDSSLLKAEIVLAADSCTSIIVNSLLGSRYTAWAVCGAFGDNLHEPARRLAAQLGLDNNKVEILREIGELLNYNGYGARLSDLHYDPKVLYEAVHPFSDPFTFQAESNVLSKLREGFDADMEAALNCKEHPHPGKNRVYFFPDAPWARRVAGVFANLKARERRNAAHALITENSDGSLRISVRAPIDDRRDAVKLCKQFPTGGGREAAAGINSMPAEQLEEFLQLFNATYP